MRREKCASDERRTGCYSNGVRVQVGEHLLTVWIAGRKVDGSPLSVAGYSADRVRLEPLGGGAVGHPVQFVGECRVRLSSPSSSPHSAAVAVAAPAPPVAHRGPLAFICLTHSASHPLTLICPLTVACRRSCRPSRHGLWHRLTTGRHRRHRRRFSSHSRPTQLRQSKQ